MVPFKKRKPAKSIVPKRDDVPDQVRGKSKKNRDGGVMRDPFSKTVTSTTPRMARQVRGK